MIDVTDELAAEEPSRVWRSPPRRNVEQAQSLSETA
jgi:hypothetical protein